MKLKSFLLADDDLDDIQMFAEALEQIDQTVVFYRANDGKQALETLQLLSELPSLIFLDINMPGMNGWQCLRELKKNARFQHIPVAMYSTSSNEREINIATELGAVCFFMKPYDFNDLKAMLAILLENIDKNLLTGFEKIKKLPGITLFVCNI